MQLNPSYKFPLFLAIALHLLLFIALFLHWVPQMHWGEGNIVRATLVASEPTRPKSQPVSPRPTLQAPTPIKKIDTHAAAREKQLLKQQQAKQAQLKLKQQQAALAKRQALQRQQQLNQQLQAAQQKLLQQQLTQEQQQLTASATANKQAQSEIDKYKALIVQTISQNWLVPDDTDKNLSCQLLIQVGPGGAVLGVQVVKSSGDPALDHSATAAVFKSSPLPTPNDPQLFDKFRQLRLTVRPENVISQSSA